MIDFDLFCNLDNYLLEFDKECPLNLDNQLLASNVHILKGMRLSENSSSDDAVFSALIEKCDTNAIHELMDYFSADAPLQKILKERLNELQHSQHKVTDSDAKSKSAKKQTSEFYSYLEHYATKIKNFGTLADFYNYAGISRQRISKLKMDDSSISREFTLHMAVGLELNYEEAVDFFKKAGYNFKPRNRREAIVSYMMRNKKYTFSQMEEILYVFNEKTFMEV